MELASNSKLAFGLNAAHVHCSKFNSMHVLAFGSTQKKGWVSNRYWAWASTPTPNSDYCLLVRRQIANKTGAQRWGCMPSCHGVDLKARVALDTDWSVFKAPIEMFWKQESRRQKVPKTNVSDDWTLTITWLKLDDFVALRWMTTEFLSTFWHLTWNTCFGLNATCFEVKAGVVDLLKYRRQIVNQSKVSDLIWSVMSFSYFA